MVMYSNNVNISLRAIRTMGIEVFFHRYEKDEFGEINYSQSAFSVNIRGLFHNGSSTYRTTNTDTGSVTTSKQTPMLLCAYSQGCQVCPDDRCEINGQKFKVLSLTDVNNENKLIDISMEEIPI